MASDPVTSWQIDQGKVETDRFYFLGLSEITVDGECNHEIKSHLLLGRKAMTNLDSILKRRDIILWIKVHIDSSAQFSHSLSRVRLFATP